MIVKTTKGCDVKIIFRGNKFFLITSANDGYRCEVAELTILQAKILADFIARHLIR